MIGLGLREWGWTEVFAGLRAAAGPAARRADEVALRHWFEQAFGVPALMLDSGSSALRLALDEIAAGAQATRDEVILPALACPALTRVVLDCGLRPCYADIGPDLNTPVDAVRACLGPRSLALVMVHAYGHAADASGLRSLCEQHDIALIDDAAQRIEPASGLGRQGRFGVFSFAQSKNIVSGIGRAGGVLLLNDERHRAALRSRAASLPLPPQRRSHWLQFLLSGRLPRLAYYIARWRSRGTPASSAPGRIGAIDAAIARRQLASLDSRRTQRLEVLARYRNALAEQGVEAPQLSATVPVAYLARLMVRVDPQRRDACRAALAAAGVASRLPYRLPDVLPEGACPQARRSATDLIELPLPRRLSVSQAREIAACVAAFRPHSTPPSGA